MTGPYLYWNFVVAAADDVVALLCDLDLEYACGLGEELAGWDEMPGAGGGADIGVGEVTGLVSGFCDWGHGEN